MPLGYAADSKARKLWDSELCSVIVYKDVVFDEIPDCADAESIIEGW